MLVPDLTPDSGPSTSPGDNPAAPVGDRRPGGRAGAIDLTGVKVLLVEDEFVIALDFQILLYRFGCEVLGPVGSAAEALVILRHERPDAAVLDINLRDGLVLPVAARLGELDIPYLLVTARDARRFPDALLADAPMLSKPVDEDGLRRALARLLAPA